MTLRQKLLTAAGAQTPPEPPLLADYFDGVPALAKALGKTERSVWRWRAQGRGPPGTFIGGRLYFRKTAVKEWLLAREELP